MIRVIVATCDANMAAHVGGPVHTEYRTFEVDAPELEAFMAERFGPHWRNGLTTRSIVGVEVPQPTGDPHD